MCPEKKSIAKFGDMLFLENIFVFDGARAQYIELKLPSIDRSKPKYAAQNIGPGTDNSLGKWLFVHFVKIPPSCYEAVCSAINFEKSGGGSRPAYSKYWRHHGRMH
jgi:hypothetical protein